MALSWEKIPASEFEKGNSLYKKDTTGYKEVEKEHLYNARRIWGIDPVRYPNKRWDKEFETAIKDVPEGSTIYVTGGRYENEATLEIRRNVSIVGDVEKTLFSGPGNKPVFYVGHQAAGATFKNFVTTHLNKDPQIGYLGDNTYSKDFEPYAGGSGMMVQGVVTIEGVRGFRLSGHAFYIFGAIGGGMHTDTSNAKIIGCFANENEGGGYIIDGPDANFMTLERISASDNKMIGLWDSSFLGINVAGYMSHYNKMGAIHSSPATARTHIYGAYDESGSVPSYLGQRCFVSGFLGSGFVGEGCYQEGPYMFGQQRWGDLIFKENELHFGFNALRRRENNKWAVGRSNDKTDDHSGWVERDGVLNNPFNRDIDKYQSGTNEAGEPVYSSGRQVQQPGLFSYLSYVGDRIVGAIPSRYYLQEMHLNFSNGDRLTNSAHNGRNPVEFICIKPGYSNGAQFKAYGNGSGLFVDGPGDVIYKSLHKDLMPIDAGWKYYATDQKKEYTWTGEVFI